MAQASRGEQAEEVNGSSIERGDEEEGEDAAEGSAGFKLNVHAPEFVPRSQSQAVPPPLSGCFYPCLPFFENGCGGAALGPGWFYFAEQEPIHFIPDFHAKVAAGHSKGSNDVIQKIVKQVEYQFSDTNLVANDFLMKIMNKDPQGFGEYRDDDATDGRFGRQINPAKPLIHTLSSSLLVPVPMSVVASWKKIKSLGANHHMLIKALRTSTKLALSEDGKKVRRKQLFTERDKEELQSRTVVVENLPEDYSRQNLGKLFSVVGSVKNIRICHPQEPSSARSSKGDVLISNKLHALVEYESTEQAETAVEKLNDERNWRKGLRVRTMLRCSPKSVIRSKKLDYDHFDLYAEDDRSPSSQALGSPRTEHLLDHSVNGRQPKRFQKRTGKGASEVAWTTASESQWERLTAPLATVRRRPRPWRSLEQADSAGAKNARRHARVRRGSREAAEPCAWTRAITGSGRSRVPSPVNRKPAAVENTPLSFVATVKDVVMIGVVSDAVLPVFSHRRVLILFLRCFNN
ncbi:hypothetical protein MUK42_10992 [Musa troglodytarum]|uniref:La-related protein 6C n=1 Tax=Musa troglodytarum TaxID=320322 RepID=A0A9E7KI83_9LILI|nr:hypothetical protein MUK42_10992 [Musa troglodytarum]